MSVKAGCVKLVVPRENTSLNQSGFPVINIYPRHGTKGMKVIDPIKSIMKIYRGWVPRQNMIGVKIPTAWLMDPMTISLSDCAVLSETSDISRKR